jgi:hypothetical protein
MYELLFSSTRLIELYWTFVHVSHTQEECENTKGVIIIHKSKQRQHNGQKKKEKEDKQPSTKHYT